MSALPLALSQSVASIVENIPSSELAARTRAMSAAYRAGGGSSGLRDAADIGAYLITRLPATYAAVATALDACAEHLPDFAPRSLLDAGAGPGTASWAASALWPGIDSITMLDKSPQLRDAARRLCQAGGTEALRDARIVDGDFAAGASLNADLVVACYALGEAADAASALKVLWRACTGVLVIVEPGTPAGFARIREWRAMLIGLGARIVAPCPGAYPCPIAGADWCHFSVRLPRLRAHKHAKGADVPFEDERFSYIAVAREGVKIVPASARILAQPKRTKIGVTLKLCSDGTISAPTVSVRDKPAFKRAAKAKWGGAT